jgi:hypothetical protein
VVERRRRRELEARRRLLGLARGAIVLGLAAPRRDRLLRRAVRRGDDLGQQLDALHDLLDLVGERRGEQLGDAELVGVGARFAWWLDGTRLGREVEQARRQGDAGLAVDRGVMHLAVEADAAVDEPSMM